MAFRRLLLITLLIACRIAGLPAQNTPASGETTRWRALYVGSVGFTNFLSPAFSYSMTGDPAVRQQEEEWRGGLALSLGLEGYRGHQWGGGQVSKVSDPFGAGATLVSGYYGLSVSRGLGTVRAAAGASLINQQRDVDKLEQNICRLISFRSACPTPIDPGPISSIGPMVIIAAERSGRHIDIGFELHGGLGSAPFYGALVRLLPATRTDRQESVGRSRDVNRAFARHHRTVARAIVIVTKVARLVGAE